MAGPAVAAEPSTPTPAAAHPARSSSKPRILRLGSRTRARQVASRGVAKPPVGEETAIALWRPLPGTDFKKEPEPTAEEEEKLAQMREHAQGMMLPEDDPYHERERKWALDDPGCLLRFLRAAKGNLHEGKDRYTATCKWRRDFKPDLIAPKDIWEEAETGKVILTGFDSGGRPVMYLRPARENSKDSERKIKHLVFQLERVCDMMNNGVTKMALVVDYHGAGAKSNPGMAETRQVLEVFQRHYAERLGRAIIVNLPWYLNGFFKAISPLLDPVSREKMKFNANMTDLIPADQLDVEFGGSFNFKYDRDVYFPALCTFCGVNDDGTRIENPPVKQEVPEALVAAAAVAASIEDEEAQAAASQQAQLQVPLTPVSTQTSRSARLIRNISTGPRTIKRKLTGSSEGDSSPTLDRNQSESPRMGRRMLSVRQKSISSLPAVSPEEPTAISPTPTAVDATASPEGDRVESEKQNGDAKEKHGLMGRRSRRGRRGKGDDLRKRATTKSGWRRMFSIKHHDHAKKGGERQTEANVAAGDNADSAQPIVTVVPPSPPEDDQPRTDSANLLTVPEASEVPPQPKGSPNIAADKTLAGLTESAQQTSAEAAQLEHDVHHAKTETSNVDEATLSAGAAPVSGSRLRQSIGPLPQGVSVDLVQVHTPEPSTEPAGMALAATGGDVLGKLHSVIGSATAALDRHASNNEKELNEEEMQKKIADDGEKTAKIVEEAAEAGVAGGDGAKEVVAVDGTGKVADAAIVVTDPRLLARRITENSIGADDLDFDVGFTTSSAKPIAAAS